MDKVVFLIDDNNHITCTYYEYNDEERYLNLFPITLDQIELYEIYNSFLKKYSKDQIEMINNGSSKNITFYDVDYYEMQKIKKTSLKYKEALDIKTHKAIVNSNNISYQKENTNKENKPKKLVRKNNFQKTLASVSAAVLIAITSYSAYRVINNEQATFKASIDNNIQSMEYVPDLNFKWHPSNNVYSLDEENSNKDNTINDNSNFFEETDITETKKNELNNDNSNSTENDNITNDNLGNNLDNEYTSNNNENIDTTKDNNSQEDTDENILNERVDAVLKLDAEDATDMEKYYITKAYYYDAISTNAKKYGLDPNLVLAIATHERGVHSDMVDSGGGIGLFQIQVRGGWNWSGQTISAYNFETGEYDNVTITEDSVSDVFENIKVGCMMIQNSLAKYNYNIALAITAYNYGDNYLEKVINTCSMETGFSTSELKEMNNLEWLSYRDIISGGDTHYLENVCKYIPNDTVLSFKNINNGEDVFIKYENINYQNDKGVTK